MNCRLKFDFRSICCFGSGLIVLIVLTLPALLVRQVSAQTSNTSTPTLNFPILIAPQYTLIAPKLFITKSVPTFMVSNIQVLNLKSIQLTGGITKTTADIDYSNQFKGSINIQSPTSMMVNESRVITLEVVPETLAQASMVHAELHAVTFESADDGQPDKTVVVNVPVKWNWAIASKNTGQQEFFLAISYVNNQGSRVYWQNITLIMTVSAPSTATDTPPPPPTLTLTPSPTPIPPVAPTSIPTLTSGQKAADAILSNPVPVVGVAVTLLLGLLSIYFQYVRKKKPEK